MISMKEIVLDLNPIENDFAIIKSIREYSDATSLDDIIKMYN